MRRSLYKSMKLTLTYNPNSGSKPFELLKDNQDYGRKYSGKGVQTLIYELKNYQGTLIITADAQKALDNLKRGGLEQIAS